MSNSEFCVLGRNTLVVIVKEDVNHLRTRRSSECYLKQMAWFRHKRTRIGKAVVVEKASSSSGKREWRIYSAIFLLISYLLIGLLW